MSCFLPHDTPSVLHIAFPCEQKSFISARRVIFPCILRVNTFADSHIKAGLSFALNLSEVTIPWFGRFVCKRISKNDQTHQLGNITKTDPSFFITESRIMLCATAVIWCYLQWGSTSYTAWNPGFLRKCFAHNTGQQSNTSRVFPLALRVCKGMNLVFDSWEVV